MSRKLFFSSEFPAPVIPGTHLFGDFLVTDGEDDDRPDTSSVTGSINRIGFPLRSAWAISAAMPADCCRVGASSRRPDAVHRSSAFPAAVIPTKSTEADYLTSRSLSIQKHFIVVSIDNALTAAQSAWDRLGQMLMMLQM